jgi:fumarylacetoacetate (FAA) hydrolase
LSGGLRALQAVAVWDRSRGWLSNYDDEVGGACIAERRVIEAKRTGSPITAYLQPGDELKIEMLDRAGKTIFGAIQQSIEAARLSSL